MSAQLVVGADVLSRFTDPSDRGTAALFGDGAGAVVVLPSGRGGIGPAVLGSDGSRAELIETAREEGVIRMKGPDTYRQAVDRLSEASAQAAELAGVRAHRDRRVRLPSGQRPHPDRGRGAARAAC